MSSDGNETTAISIVRMEGIVAGLASNVGEMKDAMRQLTEAVTKLAIVEVRQAEAGKATERAFIEIDKVDRRLVALAERTSALETAQPLQKQSADWVQKVIWLVVAAVVGALVASVVIPHPPHLPHAPYAAPEAQEALK